jgi:hypothetical protein
MQPRAYVNPAFGFPLGFRGGARHDAAASAIFPRVAGERDDEPGVLGNLPRSRPGRRSDKRGGAAAARAKAKKPATPRKRAATTTARATPKTQAPRTRPQAQRPRPQPAQKSSDPVTQAVELAGKAAALGVRTAVGIMKRLPRP